MADKKKIGWALNAPFVEGVEQVASAFGRPGLKATCAEAALLGFFRLPREQQADLIQEVERGELTDTLAELVKGAIESSPRPLRMAARSSPPSGGRRSPER